ncbi:periplasmic heavy metal sensor [Coraliomargarita sp. SDUM461003]|uniref:Periplasmic heavy metal sensor n=1 Tax=Thalassobacterium maritimum TaxID=3041265 RepID=A0ABU1AZ68_9BACT|nr:periplasmic heavy metal sensor [Coraliomargarita sp. SDUM461003]MDQ8209443.1 periplasmic heavy metal sensor [Coraliomargarita sp. SDUM461003]
MSPNHRSLWVKRILSLGVIALLFVVLCVGLSVFVTRSLTNGSAGWRNDMSEGHQWLHEALELTAQERAAIDSFEGQYHQERDELTREFDARIANLRQILVESDEYVPAVDRAIHRIHEVHGQLQELSIQHYYDMLSVLPPQKQDKLRELAVQALSQPE